MKIYTDTFLKMAATIVFALALFAPCLAFQTREQTTIQTASVEVKGKPAAISVKYLDLPWGEKSFSFIEKGDDNYYGTRNWPFARLITTVSVKLEDHDLAPGSYALVLNPARKGQPMAITVVKLPGDAEFLQSGNVFVEVPAGQTVFTAPSSFETVDKVIADHMKITLETTEKGVTLTVLYGNRKLIRTLVIG